MDGDYAIIGGGIVGLSIAYGLLNIGKRVTIFDEGDDAIRARSIVCQVLRLDRLSRMGGAIAGHCDRRLANSTPSRCRRVS